MNILSGIDNNRSLGSAVPRSASRRAAARVATLGLAMALTVTACPVQRPLLPDSYPGFRYELELAIRDTAMAVLAERPAERERLEGRLTELSSLVIVDSLVSRLRSDPELSRLGAAVDAVVEAQLTSDELGGDVREAFETAPGQRLASDAIIVGLGRALYLIRGGVEGG